MNPTVVVVGSFVQDQTFVCREFPRPGETTLGRFLTGPGGKGSNQAVAAVRAGAATRFIGAVGRDAFADAAAKFHQREGIDSRLVAKKNHPTATAGIVVNARGENQIVVALGANAELRPRDVPAAWLRDARVVVAQHEASLAINAHVFRLARRLGATTVLNPAPMRGDFDAAILGLVDVLIPNENEFVALARSLGHTLHPDALTTLDAARLQPLCRALGVPVVVLTLGARGCFVSLADAGTHLPAHRVKVVDTTGAGDAFVGAFAAGLVAFDRDVLRAARFANAAAALSVTKFGTAAAMPTARALARHLRTSIPRSRYWTFTFAGGANRPR